MWRKMLNFVERKGSDNGEKATMEKKRLWRKSDYGEKEAIMEKKKRQ